MSHEIPRYELRLVPARITPDGVSRTPEYRVIDKADGTAIGWMPTKAEALEYLGAAAFEDNTVTG